jgi:hypothetical protein
MDDNVTRYEINVNKQSCICTCLPLVRLKEPASEGAHYVANVTVSVLTILTFIPGILLNTLVLMAYRKNRQLRISSNMSLMVLAATDLFVCAVVQPLYVVRKIAEIYTTFNFFLWVAFRIISQCGFGISLTTLAVISVERFVTLAYPFRYQAIVTQKRLKIVLALFPAILCLTSLAQLSQKDKEISAAFISVFIISSLLIIAATWLWIHRLTARHKRRINALSAPSNFTKIIRNTKTCYFVVGSSLICFLPTFAVLVFYLIVTSESIRYFTYNIINPFFIAFLNVNSLVNPVVLLYRKRDFRGTVKQFLF